MNNNVAHMCPAVSVTDSVLLLYDAAVGLSVAAVQLKSHSCVKFGLLCCSGQIHLAAAGLKPGAIKTLPYSTEEEKARAEAELQALYDTRHIESVMACYGVFLDTTPDGSHCLQLITE